MKALLPLIIAVCLFSFLAGGTFFSRTVYLEQEKPVKLLPLPVDSKAAELPSTKIYVPAVDEKGQGVLTEIGVSVEEGTGRTLANIENILFFVDTQNSIRTARDVAQEITGFDLSNRDIVYAVRANASIIEGPSAGAALTIATIAALEGKKLSDDVMITGTIRPDGTIGKVGQVQEKANTAKKKGAKIFLVPKNGEVPSSGIEYEKVTDCRTVENVQFCETKYVKKQSSGIGIDVREVASIKDALPYFIS